MDRSNSMNRFLNVIKGCADQKNKPDTMIFGKVTEINPLKIDIGNNSRNIPNHSNSNHNIEYLQYNIYYKSHIK